MTNVKETQDLLKIKVTFQTLNVLYLVSEIMYMSRQSKD